MKCTIQGKEREALWDADSQIYDLEVLRNVDELLGDGEELNLEAMNGTEIQFDKH